MEETNNISNNNTEEGAKGLFKKEKILSQLQDLKKKVKEDIKRLSILYLFGTLMPTPSTKHLNATMDRVNKSTVAGNALLDCYNSLKGLTLENKMFVLEILANKLFNPTEAEILTSLVQLDNHCRMGELVEAKPVKSDKSNEEEAYGRIEAIEEFREFINTVLQLRFNEEEK